MMPAIYKAPCSFVNKWICGDESTFAAYTFGMGAYQDRLEVAVKRAGGQAQLAKLVNDRFGLKISQQTINYLLNRKRVKPAVASKYTPQIAAVSGLNAQWLASGRGLRDAVSEVAEGVAPVRAAPTIETTTEVDGVELTRAAIEVAKAWMDLPRNERDEFKRKIETAALRHSAAIPDNELEHLSAAGKRKRLAPNTQ